jgi:hypothetical protein
MAVGDDRDGKEEEKQHPFENRPWIAAAPHLEKAKETTDRVDDSRGLAGDVSRVSDEEDDQAARPAQHPAQAQIAGADLKRRFRTVAEIADVGVELLAEPAGYESDNDCPGAAK